MIFGQQHSGGGRFRGCKAQAVVAVVAQQPADRGMAERAVTVKKDEEAVAELISKRRGAGELLVTHTY